MDTPPTGQPSPPMTAAGRVSSRRGFLTTAGALAGAALAEPVLRPPPAATVTTATLAATSGLHRDRGGAHPPSPAEAFRLLDEKILAAMAKYLIPGAAVGVLYRGHEHVRGFGITSVDHPTPVDGDTLFRIGSTTKTFTGTAAMRLVDAGKLDLAAQVRRYLPDFQAPPGAETVTVRELLNHSAGWLGEDFQDTGRGADAIPRYVAGMHNLPQLTPPGATFAYNNAALVLAGRVVEAVTKHSYEDAVGDLLLRPLSMRHSFFFSDEIIGYNIAAPHATLRGKAVVLPGAWYLPRSINPAGGLISSAADQLSWARFQLGDGRAPDGQRLLTAASLKAMQSHPGPGGTLLAELTGMGVTWMLRPTAQGVRIIQHGGTYTGQRSGFWMVPQQHFAMTLLTNSESAAPLIEELFAGDWALRLFTGLTNLPAPERRLSSAELAAYEGRYTSQAVDGTGRLIDNPPKIITGHDGVLRVTGQGAPAELLTFYRSPFGPDYVLVNNANGTTTHTRANFIRDSAGRIRWLRHHGRLYRRQT